MSNNNNNNNDAFTVGDLLINKRHKVHMVLHQSVNNTYNAIVKTIKDMGLNHRGYGDDLNYDCGNYTRDRTNYYADLDVVKTKSEAKPNPRYGLTIIAPCDNVGEKRAFIWHEDCGRTQKVSMERSGFLPIGDERMAYQETVADAHRKILALSAYCSYISETGMLEYCSHRQVGLLLKDKSIKVSYSIELPECMSHRKLETRRPNNDATLEEMKEWVAMIEKTGEDCNDWFGLFQKEWFSSFSFRNTFHSTQKWKDMFDGLEEHWSQRGRNYLHHDSNRFFSSYNWCVLQEFMVWALGSTIAPHYEAMVEALQGEGRIDDFFDKCNAITNGELWAVCQKHGLDRNDYSNTSKPDIRWIKDFPNKEQFLAYLDCDRSIFDEPTLYKKTAYNYGKDYHFALGHCYTRWGERHWEVGEKIDKLIEALGGEYSLWD